MLCDKLNIPPDKRTLEKVSTEIVGLFLSQSMHLMRNTLSLSNNQQSLYTPHTHTHTSYCQMLRWPKK